MSQPITDRSTLPAFLPQFAEGSEDSITPATILNGDATVVNGVHPAEHEPLNGLDGHTIEMFIEAPTASRISDSDFLATETSNGAADHVALDRSELQPAVSVNGLGQQHHLNGAAQHVPALEPMADAVHAAAGEPVMQNVASELVSDPVIDDRPLPSAEQAEASVANEVNGPPAAGSRLPNSVPEHPASGSMFAPYLVTEIRELRHRASRRRSWWRRLFG